MSDRTILMKAGANLVGVFNRFLNNLFVSDHCPMLPDNVGIPCLFFEIDFISPTIHR